ncbi:hypothetical protein GDO86_007374 [Hymenochirus boettgeri]|uniref:LRRNT domain-containing protein n=1 Tax=Hymenochirus boettgeri TaxID=247094 RepID=A0A8T2ITG2_9PIPI|nr:hypothetical protein GDO86_007374 [Hymenochirus boettgeri]
MEILIKASVVVLLCVMRGLCQNDDYDYDTDYGPGPEEYPGPYQITHNTEYSGPPPSYPNGCARECFCPPTFPQTMYCDNRKLKEIPNIPSHIQQVYLQFNDIEGVKVKSFINATALKEINLSHNRIKSNKIEALVFSKLHNLEQLFMDHNELEEIPPDLPNSIERIFLGFNRIFKLKEHDLRGLVKLTMLDLCNNQIDNFKGKTVNKLENLMQLNICNNKLHAMPGNLPPSIMYLSLENNSISKIPEDYFTKLQNLVAIRMSHNNLEEIPIKMFNLPNLMELNLGHNKLKQVFLIPKTLEHLYLQDNEFEVLNITKMCPVIDHLNPNRLTYLRLDQNKLKAPISMYAYLCFPHMQRIYYGEQKRVNGEYTRIQEPMLTHPPVSEEEDEDDEDDRREYAGYYQHEHGADTENYSDNYSY